MAVTVQASGSTLTDGTEQTLTSINVAGVFQLYADLNILAAGDIVEFRPKAILKTGGTLRVLDVIRVAFEDVSTDRNNWALGDPVWNALTDTASVRYTMTMITANNRTIDWQVLKA